MQARASISPTGDYAAQQKMAQPKPKYSQRLSGPPARAANGVRSNSIARGAFPAPRREAACPSQPNLTGPPDLTHGRHREVACQSCRPTPALLQRDLERFCPKPMSSARTGCSPPPRRRTRWSRRQGVGEWPTKHDGPGSRLRFPRVQRCDWRSGAAPAGAAAETCRRQLSVGDAAARQDSCWLPETAMTAFGLTTATNTKKHNAPRPKTKRLRMSFMAAPMRAPARAGRPHQRLANEFAIPE
jgi:hypothetical protein